MGVCRWKGGDGVSSPSRIMTLYVSCSFLASLYVVVD